MRFILALLSFLVVGCSSQQKLVRLSEQTLPKTTYISVSGTMQTVVLKFDGKSTYSFEATTVPVRVQGAGVYISENNHVLTCSHLFELLTISSVTVCDYDGSCYETEILFREPNLDLALLRTNSSGRSSPIRLADPRKTRVGQEVYAIGTPLGFPFSVSHGIISAMNRDQLGVYNMIQSDTFLNPGNSGGGLFNMDGELIGINSRIVPPVNASIFTGLGFSVDSGQIIEFLTRFRGLDKNIPKYGSDYWSSLFRSED